MAVAEGAEAAERAPRQQRTHGAALAQAQSAHIRGDGGGCSSLVIARCGVGFDDSGRCAGAATHRAAGQFAACVARQRTSEAAACG